MEYKNDNFTPLDGVDGELLRSILGSTPAMMPCPSDATCESCARGRRRGMARAEMPASDIDGDNTTSPCGCDCYDDFKAPQLRGVPLSMVYSPEQKWENIYECDYGLTRGTIFKCLDFPFEQSKCHGDAYRGSM